MRRIGLAIAMAWPCACGDGGEGRETGAETTGSTAGDADSDATTDATSTSTSASTTSASTDGSTTTAAASDGSSGGTYDCDEIGYQGVCDGDTLIWCENGTIMMADCAAMGEVCAWESDRVGNNCVPGG